MPLFKANVDIMISISRVHFIYLGS